MMDVAEILMMEHASIRNAHNNIAAGKGEVAFSEFLDYLRDCHIEIEERVLLPVLRDIFQGSDIVFMNTAERIINDHKLLEKLGNNIVIWMENEDVEKVGERMPLFFKLLLDHNNSEELIIFPAWKTLNTVPLKNTISECRDVIENYGNTKYEKITGISKKFLEYVFSNI